MNVCTCGHDQDDHGRDEKYPGSTSCEADDCDCIAFEAEDEGSTLHGGRG